MSLSLHSRYPTPYSESSSFPLSSPPTPQSPLRHLLESAVLLGQPTSSSTPLYPFWRPLWASVALLPYLFSASITFGRKSPSAFFGLATVVIPALEHLASPGAVPLGPALPPPWRTILGVCPWSHCSAALPVFALDIIPPHIWAQLPHIFALAATLTLLQLLGVPLGCFSCCPQIEMLLARFRPLFSVLAPGLPFRLCPLFQTLLLPTRPLCRRSDLACTPPVVPGFLPLLPPFLSFGVSRFLPFPSADLCPNPDCTRLCALPLCSLSFLSFHLYLSASLLCFIHLPLSPKPGSSGLMYTQDSLLVWCVFISPWLLVCLHGR